jgi:hypothetical protein
MVCVYHVRTVPPFIFGVVAAEGNVQHPVQKRTRLTMEQSSSLEADTRSVSEEVAFLSRNSTVS